MNENPMDLFEEMDEMFDRLFMRMDREFTSGNPQVYGYRIVISNDGPPGGMPEIPPPSSRLTHEPVAEVHRIGDETKVVAELPGATGESIRLDVKGNMLIIDAGDAENHYHTTADLPPVEAASMQRSLRNGVLEVTFRNLVEAPGTTEPGKN
jgi:HSP20 family protein